MYLNLDSLKIIKLYESTILYYSNFLSIIIIIIYRHNYTLYTNRFIVFKVPLVKSKAPDKGLATRPTIP